MVSTEGASDSTQQLGNLGSSTQAAMPIEIENVIIGMAASMTFSVLTEFIAWFMTYRHDEYKKEVAEALTLQERVEAMQEKMEYSKGY